MARCATRGCCVRVPLLDHAALDAVKQWRYAPTRLNGVAVPVIVTVTVQFRLQR